jgi:hypothetical protein
MCILIHLKGYKVIVLEAKGVVGGRTYTHPQLGIDWGAGW